MKKAPYLKILEKEAKQFKEFKDFSLRYSADACHGLYWHITEKKEFKIDPKKSPKELGSSSHQSKKPGLMVTGDIENWEGLGYGKKGGRNYAALIDTSDLDVHEEMAMAHGGKFGHELFIKKPSKAKVLKVFDIDKAKRYDRQAQKRIPASPKELLKIFKKAHKL